MTCDETNDSTFKPVSDKKIEKYQLDGTIKYLIEKERRAQMRKFGVQLHPKETWLTILTEEVGEVAKEMCNLQFPRFSKKHPDEARVDLKNELIQVIAVGISWLEQLQHVKNDPNFLRLNCIECEHYIPGEKLCSNEKSGHFGKVREFHDGCTKGE